MNLVKWLRKNNKKVMAVVVIVILFMFIGGDTLMKTFNSQQSNRKIATYGQHNKITAFDLHSANQELEILRELGADQFLRAQDIGGVLLAELLFSERRPTFGIEDRLGQLMRQGPFRISDRQLTEIYDLGKTPHSVYWFLLKKESEQAGVTMPPEQAGQVLVNIIPQIFQQQGFQDTYQNRMQGLVSRYHLPEQAILQVFARLMAVWQYAQFISGTEDTTPLQARHQASIEQESIDANFVQLDAMDWFKLVDVNQTLTDAKRQQQFDAYQNFTAGHIQADNPFGFGYALPARIQLEYLIVSLDDIKAKDPTPEETEEFYRRNVSTLYTSTVKVDPNDPNSQEVDQIQSYAQVIDDISKRITAQQIVTQAEIICQAAREKADISFSDANGMELSPEQLTNIPSYSTIAQQLTAQFNVPVTSGKTGLLSQDAVQIDPQLRTLMLFGRTQRPLSLSQVLFYVDPINTIDMQLLTVSKPKLFESIGPAKPYRIAQQPTNVTGTTMAVLRVIAAEAIKPAPNLKYTYDETPVRLGPLAANQARIRTAVQEKVDADLKILAGFEMARQKATELATAVQQDGWDQGLTSFNQRYSNQLQDNPKDPNVVKITENTRIQRTPLGMLSMLALQSESQAWALTQYQRMMADSQLGQKLYDLVIPPANQIKNQHTVLAVEAQASVYLVRDVQIQRLSLEDYQKSQARVFYQEKLVGAKSLSAIHLNPANILKRSGFAWPEEENVTDSATTKE